MFKCNEKGRMREELIIEWPREVLDRRPGFLLMKKRNNGFWFFKGSLNTVQTLTL
jgi:hypothetical protein